MTQNENAEIIQLHGSDIAYQQDKAQIDVQISTAKAYPRNIKRAVENSIAIATMDVATAGTCTYALPRGGKKVTGPSVNLAKIIAQNWGNLRIETKVIDVDKTTVTSQAIAFDLETNIAIKVEVKRSILQNENVNGKPTGRKVRMNEDMIVVTGNAGNSIALRNAVFAIIPKAVTDRVYNEALKTITGDLSDETKLIKKRKQVVDGLKDTYKVTEAEILQAVGKAAIEHLQPDDIAVLIGIGTSIKEGDATIDEVFRPKKGATETKPNPEINRLGAMIEKFDSVFDLETIRDTVDATGNEELMLKFNKKMKEVQNVGG